MQNKGNFLTLKFWSAVYYPYTLIGKIVSPWKPSCHCSERWCTYCTSSFWQGCMAAMGNLNDQTSKVFCICWQSLTQISVQCKHLVYFNRIHQFNPLIYIPKMKFSAVISEWGRFIKPFRKPFIAFPHAPRTIKWMY